MKSLLLLLLTLTIATAADAPFEIRDGDRVLLLGDTLLERENTYGYLETRMHEQFPDRHFTVRNLSWAGDTPKGWSRASFDPPAKGWERLQASIAEVRPTVVFLGYGMAASLQEMTDRSGDITLNRDETRYGAEPYSVVRFKKELGELMDAIKAGEPAVRFVLLSPIRHEDLRKEKPGLPDPAPHNALLEQYSKGIEELAKERGARFVDLRADNPFAKIRLGTLFITDNGIHLKRFGYDATSAVIAQAFGWATKVDYASVGFVGPNVKPEDFTSPTAQLRAAVLKKNELFFHRFRPENATYLFGFRKHEQGQNAKEIPAFDPLIAAMEVEIDRLKKGGVAAKVEPAKPDNALAKAEPPPRPTFTVAKGYQIELWAENPLLEKPTQMNWDALGRLWVCSSSLYPQIAPGEVANDKILILEDTDRDGKADKSTLFTAGLLIPTGVVPDLVTTKNAKGAKEEGGEKKGNAPALQTPLREAPNSNLSTLNPQLSTFPNPQLSTLPNACYVGQSTELLHFTDTDGDGKADQKRVVFSGFGTEDTHHLIHTLRWGPDGRLHFNQSIYIHSHLETPYGMVRMNSGAVFAYDPRTERLEVLFKGLCNPWGHAWDQWGQSFLTDGAGSGGINWGVPGAMYFTYENGRRIMPSVSPGSYPKFASLEFIHSPHFPADWQGHAITCDFRAHRIVRFAIEDLAEDSHAKAQRRKEGKEAGNLGVSAPLREPSSGYITREMPDLVRTTDQSFRPIDVRLGPDGALYVADWSNPVINHGEVDFRDPRRDKHMGRIWRISKKDAPVVKWEPLVGKTNAQLLDGLLSKSAWEQQGARKILQLRGRAENHDPSADLEGRFAGGPLAIGIGSLAWAEDRKTERAQAEAMWLGAGFGYQSEEALLSDVKEARFRAAAVRVLAQSIAETERNLAANPTTTARFNSEDGREWLGKLNKALEKQSADENPRVRLEAMRALARIPTARSAELVLDAAVRGSGDQSAIRDPQSAISADPYYDYAAWLSINDLAKPWTEAIASGAWKAEGNEKQLEFALKSIDPALAGATLARLVSDKKVPLDGTGPWIEILGTAGGPKELGALFAKLTAGQFDKAVTRRVLAAFAEAARLRNVKPEGDLAAIVKLGNDDAYKAGVARLIGRWKLPSGHGVLAASATHPDPKVRLAAFEAMRDFGGKDVLAALPLLTDPKMPGDVRAQAALTFATLDLKGSQPRVFALLAGLESENDALTAWRGLLAIKGAADTLAAGLPKDLPKPIATAGIRAAREAGKNGAKLLAALTPLAGITEAEAKMPKDFTALAGFAKQNGDPARGELIYRRTALACTVCHAIGGAGGKVGPDMTSMGASAPLDYIIESVINPAAKVKEGYNAVTLALKDGKQFTGTQVRETAQEVFLLDATGREQSVPKAQIAGTTNMGSLMPAGLVDQLQDRERLDLFAFLGELGKPGGYDASKGTVARVWQLTAGPMTIPVYTLVDGRLVKDLLAEKLPLFAGAKTVTATARFQSTAGTTRLKITGATKATLDGKPIDPTKDLALPLSADTHTLTVEIDPANPPAVLRAESPDARFLGD